MRTWTSTSGESASTLQAWDGFDALADVCIPLVRLPCCKQLASIPVQILRHRGRPTRPQGVVLLGRCHHELLEEALERRLEVVGDSSVHR
jgi:hypothetical protein